MAQEEHLRKLVQYLHFSFGARNLHGYSIFLGKYVTKDQGKYNYMSLDIMEFVPLHNSMWFRLIFVIVCPDSDIIVWLGLVVSILCSWTDLFLEVVVPEVLIVTILFYTFYFGY